MSCNGICHRYKATKPTGKARYQVGQKRCNQCNVYIIWDGLFCPCCNAKLRVGSRYTRLKEKYLTIKRV